MEPFVNGAFAFIGLGVIVAGVTGLRLPPGDRLSGLLALAVGGGTGIVALALGSLLVDGTTEDSSNGYNLVFFVAAALGFVAVAVSSAMAVRAAARGPQQSTAQPPAA